MAGNRAAKGVIYELSKRVPKNQLEQFNKFLDLNAKYKARVNKYPEKLPRIDWEDYRTNVRIEAIKMVDEFEKKYEELNKIFDDRSKLDTKKYYDEVEKQRAEVQVQVKQYIDESNQRIKAYEAEIARLCDMKPYSSMTIEEFINLRPEHSDYIPHSRKPLFWPHDPDEQIPGPVGMKKPGQGDSGGSGGDGSHPFQLSDFKGKTETFEFNTNKIHKMKSPAETKAVEVATALAPVLSMATKPIEAKPPPPNQFEAKSAEATQVETVEETTQNISSEREKTKVSEVKLCADQVNPPKCSAEKVAEPKIYIDKPISAEVRRKLDPCNLFEKQNKKEETAADRGTTVVQSYEDPCKTGFGVEIKPIQMKALDSKMAKTKSEPKSSTSCQPVESKAIKILQSCAEQQKPMMVAEPDGKDACKDHSTADVSGAVSESKNGDSCAPTPYYNPFRSEEENRQKEEEACDECKDEDPCTDDKRSPNATYYNPFKDNKKKK